LVTVPKYRIQATEIAKIDEKINRDKKLDKGKTKEQIKEEDEKVGNYNIIGTSFKGFFKVLIVTYILCNMYFRSYEA